MTPSSVHRQPPEFIWTGSGIFILTLHLLGLIVLPWYFSQHQPGWPIYLVTLLVAYLSIMGVTAGYHRLYSHRAYQLAKPIEAVFLFLGTLALQGPVLRWSFDHRAHHRFVDRDDDPYTVCHGFWHAHVLWLFRRQRPIDDSVKDLRANPLVRFQYQHYPLLAGLSNAMLSLLVGWWFHDFLGAFVLVFGLRLLLSYHITWCINSLAHYWGSRSYSKELTARDNYLVALITVGEGYHNYHHTFPSDYRNGIRWFHVDPGKWVIWLLSKCRLAWNLKSQPTPKIQRTLVTLDTKLLLQRLHELATAGANDLRTKLEARFESLPKIEAMITIHSNSLKARIEEIARLREERRAGRARRVPRSEDQVVRQRLRTLRQAHQAEWAEWCQLCGLILQT